MVGSKIQSERHRACEWGSGQERDKWKRKELGGKERKRRMGRRKEKREKITVSAQQRKERREVEIEEERERSGLAPLKAHKALWH